MERAKKITILLTLAVAFCFVLVSLAQAEEDKNESIPTWQIFKEGTATSVKWVKADNNRFEVYDPGTPADESDDVVWDQETGLVWMKKPDTSKRYNWYDATYGCINVDAGGRMGWRLPTVEELQSLWDTQGDGNGRSLPSGHPFIFNSDAMQLSFWTSTSDIINPAEVAYPVCFSRGCLYEARKENPYNYMWGVRGGYRYDAY